MEHTLDRNARTAPESYHGHRTEQLPSRDDVFDVLSNARRRCAVYYLQQQDGPVDLGEVVDYVTAWQYEQPLSDLDSEGRSCVYAALHQVHLPKLDATGFVDYDTDRGTVRAREKATYAQFYLEYDPGSDIAWSELYGGLVAVGVVLGTLSALSVYPFDWLGGGFLVVILLVMFGLAAVGQRLHERRNKLTAGELFGVSR